MKWHIIQNRDIDEVELKGEPYGDEGLTFQLITGSERNVTLVENLFDTKEEALTELVRRLKIFYYVAENDLKELKEGL